VVHLTDEQREARQTVVRTGTHSAPARTRAQIRLRAGADGPDAWPDERIAGARGVGRLTASRVRQQVAAAGLGATPHQKQAAGRPYRKRDGARAARRVALACSPAPEGHARWTMQVLADQLVARAVVESIDPAAVGRALNKTAASRGSSHRGSSRPRPARRC
jgi:hypothetical protein